MCNNIIVEVILDLLIKIKNKKQPNTKLIKKVVLHKLRKKSDRNTVILYRSN